jgi:hypothetical protein
MPICRLLVLPVLLAFSCLTRPVPAAELLSQPLEIEAGGRWEQTVTLPAQSPDQTPILLVRARVSRGGGGGNFVLRILINGAPLVDNWFEPRLLNKAPDFTPPGYSRQFAWFRDRPGEQNNSWFTVFHKSPHSNWTGTGQDTDYQFDLTGLVRGVSVRLGVEHSMPSLPAAMKADRAPLRVESLRLTMLPRAEVRRLRERLLGTLKLSVGKVDPQVPRGETGQQAYELTWSGRPDPGMQVTFDDLTNWTVESRTSGEVSLTASVAERLWRPRVGKLVIAKTDQSVSVALRPKKPIAIQQPFDGVNFWVYGHKHFMQPDAVTINCRALLADAEGRELSVDLGPIRMGYWMLLHGYVPAETVAKRTFPLTFKALLLQADKAKADYTLFLEGLHFYARRRHPLVFGRPEKPIFPKNDRGMLPTPPARVKTVVEATPTGARLSAVIPAGTLVYEVRTDRGCLDGIIARWESGAEFQPCAGGGLLDGDSRPVVAKCVARRVHNNRLETDWQTATGEQFRVQYGLQGMSLVIDLRAAGAWASGTAFGEVAGLSLSKTIEVPYLKIARSASMTCIACGSGLFVSVLPDFYHSDYSAVDGMVKPTGAGRLRLFNSTVYTPLTDGRRNALRDRLLVTAAPEFADTLPNHQNPRSPNLERLAPYMFVMDRAFSLNRWDTFKRYGLDHLIATDFCGIFVKGYSEGFGVRWRPHPSYTIAEVADARRKIKSLGFLFGAYADFTDFGPLNEFWDENLIALTAEGDLREAWPGSYAPKDSAAWMLARKVGQKMQEHYPPDCVYLDVSTNRGNEALDYEPGVPGAGMARSTVEGVGDSLVEARRWYGSTVSEGIFRWMYAGLTDMDYAQVKMADPLPLPLDFDLLKLHPYQIGTMMGYGPMNLLTPEEVKELGTSHEQPAPKAFYKHVATSLAYGHMVMLGYGYFPPMARSLQYYALMQGLEREYLPDQVTRIEYYDGRAFQPTSQALQSDAYHRGQVRVTYRCGLVVTVNLNPTEPWNVAQAGHDYQLPPYGWVASRGPGDRPAVLAYSAVVEGQRLDYVQCPEYIYLNAGDKRRRVGPVEVQGAAWLKRDGQGWQVIPCGRLGYWSAQQQQEKIPRDRGCPVLIIDPAGLGVRQPTVTAEAEMGGPAEAHVSPTADGRLQLQVTENTRVFCVRSGATSH